MGLIEFKVETASGKQLEITQVSGAASDADTPHFHIYHDNYFVGTVIWYQKINEFRYDQNLGTQELVINDWDLIREEIEKTMTKDEF